MLKQTLIFFFFLLVGQVTLAQSKQTGDTIFLPQNISNFIPYGYSVKDTAMGDLNLDNNKDVILVLKTIGEDTAVYTWEYKRPIILLLGHSDKTYTFAARNDNILMSYYRDNVFGDSYEGIEIKRGVFKVKQISGGSSVASEQEIAFKYSIADKTWYLFKVTEESWTRNHTQRGIEPGEDEKKTYTKRNFGVISIKKYKGWM